MTKTLYFILVLFILNIHFVSGVCGTVLVFFLSLLKPNDTTDRDWAMYCFYIFPQFAFSFGIFTYVKHTVDINDWYTANAAGKKQICSSSITPNPCCVHGFPIENTSKCKDYLSYFGENVNDSIRNQLIFMAAHFVAYSMILLFLESGIPLKEYYKLKDRLLKITFGKEILNDDVKEEKRRIETQLNSNQITDVLVASKLKKWYNKSIFAARDLNFGVKSGECFGLLGVNGAGKTTSFKMLTGDIPPSDGESFIHGLSIQRNKAEYLKHIGYCPQFDALNFTLTGREMLILFASIRGVPAHEVNNEVDKWLYRCGIKRYENRMCGKYSGGNKRRLSTAVALIGNPSLIMLDEPSAGVDPVARRRLWDVFSSVRKAGQSIVLTTHRYVK